LRTQGQCPSHFRLIHVTTTHAAAIFRSSHLDVRKGFSVSLRLYTFCAVSITLSALAGLGVGVLIALDPSEAATRQTPVAVVSDSGPVGEILDQPVR
jgi:hypothetical protein